jgi:SAM-dependent methyltransferase
MYRRLRSWLVQGLENSHITYARALQRAVGAHDRWLDLGCGHSLVPDWVADKPMQLEGRAIGIDLDQHAVRAHTGLKHRLVGDVHRLPFRDSVFDLVTANMVMEHVTEPMVLFEELHRVLRPGGRLLIHTPNARGYTTRLARLVPERLKGMLAKVIQQRDVRDVYPAFYCINTDGALHQIASAAGLEVLSCEHVLTSAQLHSVPVIGLIELLWIRRLASARHARQRPVLIAMLAKMSKNPSP